MATKNIVPRADGEGSIGKTAKKWFQGFFKKLTVETELTAPTVTASDSSTKVATTAHVKANVPKSVGSGTKPVYTDSNGKVTASNSSVGDTDTPIYMSGGTLTAMSETLFSKIVTHLASATAATISSLNTSSLFYRMLTWALTASGVQYNLTNSSAWYVCLGSLFGGLIIQGGSVRLESGIKTADVTLSLTTRTVCILTSSVVDAEAGTSGYFLSQSAIRLSANKAGANIRWIVIG